jgi:hypothetical protein
MESQMNMDTIRINIKYIMLGMITAGTVGMTTIITEALRNFS